LETIGLGGTQEFTVSFWFKTDSFDQGDYQALFSNNNASTENFSWQLDSHGENITLKSKGNTTLTYPESNLSVDSWYHVVIRKENDAEDLRTRVFITALNESLPSLVMNQDANPGGLQMFRIGTNRNTNSFFRMDLSNLKIYDDATVDLTNLLAEGPQLSAVPEPPSGTLLGLGALALVLRRRRHEPKPKLVN